MVEAEGWRLHRVVHSSNLLRAWQTAQILAEGLAPAVDTQVSGSDLLAERGLGSGANLSISQLQEITLRDPRCGPLPENWKADSRFRLPLMGAESLMDSGRRIADYITSVMRELPDSSDQVAVLFVGHGAGFRHAAHLLGALEFDEIGKLSMFHARPVALATSGQNRWQQVAGKWKIRPQTDSELD